MQKTKELFLERNETKQWLEFHGKTKFAEIGEIWICYVGVNIGGEISKEYPYLRPVLVTKNNLGRDLVQIIPFSTQRNEYLSEFYIPFQKYSEFGMDKFTYLVTNQIRSISTKRLHRKVNNITKGGIRYNLVPEEYIFHLMQQVYIGQFPEQKKLSTDSLL